MNKKEKQETIKEIIRVAISGIFLVMAALFIGFGVSNINNDHANYEINCVRYGFNENGSEYKLLMWDVNDYSGFIEHIEFNNYEIVSINYCFGN